MRISVLVPTFRRPVDLERCLTALKAQSRRPDSVIVVTRADDVPSHAVIDALKDGLPLTHVTVHPPGVVAALNAGMVALDADVVAITDDDAAPWPDWLERIERHFQSDPRVGAVGGRDFVHQDGHLVDDPKPNVGLVQWFGRVIGNHHLGAGPARDVDLLKGVNMSFRRAAIEGLAFDTRLRGAGAQVANDMLFSLEVGRRGWRVIYDPAVAVDHYPAVRHDDDRRGQFNRAAMTNAVHNETLTLLEYLPGLRRYAFMAWALAAGDRAAPGLLQWIRLLLSGDENRSAKLAAALEGRREGWKTWRCRNR